MSSTTFSPPKIQIRILETDKLLSIRFFLVCFEVYLLVFGRCRFFPFMIRCSVYVTKNV